MIHDRPAWHRGSRLLPRIHRHARRNIRSGFVPKPLAVLIDADAARFRQFSSAKRPLAAGQDRSRNPPGEIHLVSRRAQIDGLLHDLTGVARITGGPSRRTRRRPMLLSHPSGMREPARSEEYAAAGEEFEALTIPRAPHSRHPPAVGQQLLHRHVDDDRDPCVEDQSKQACDQRRSQPQIVPPQDTLLRHSVEHSPDHRRSLQPRLGEKDVAHLRRHQRVGVRRPVDMIIPGTKDVPVHELGLNRAPLHQPARKLIVIVGAIRAMLERDSAIL